MKLPLTVLLLLTLPFLAYSQKPSDEISIGQTVQIHSDILNEDRTILVGLPDNYSAAEKYPVFYLLDGPGNFQLTTAASRFLQKNDRAPGVIIVGIANTDRTRDLTPRAVATGEPEEGDIPFDYSLGGGADNFLDFIQDELMPYVDKNYSTARYKGLIGHSFGGLFAVHSFLTRPDMFDAYIAISPSLWWDKQSFLVRADSVLKSNRELKNSFYMTMGDEGGFMLGGAMKFAALLEEYAGNMQWKFEPMPNETHGSVPFRSTYDGLEFLFSDWSPPMPTSYDEFISVMKDGVDALINKVAVHYNGLSEKYGFTVTEEAAINQLGYSLLQLDRPDDAVTAMRHNTTSFPESANAFDSLGDVYSAIGDTQNARLCYENAISLAKKYDHPIGAVSKEKLASLDQAEK